MEKLENEYFRETGYRNRLACVNYNLNTYTRITIEDSSLWIETGELNGKNFNGGFSSSKEEFKKALHLAFDRLIEAVETEPELPNVKL